MAAIPGLQRLFRLATGRSTAVRDVDDELSLHLDLRVAELVAEGMAPEAARLRAEQLFGNRHKIEDTCVRLSRSHWRAGRRMEFLHNVAQDVAYLGRNVRKSPGFYGALVLSLALGIGFNGVIASVVDAILLRPLPFREPAHLVQVFAAQAEGSFAARVPLEVAMTWARQRSVFRQVEFYQSVGVEYRGPGEPARVRLTRATPGMFSMLGVTPALGRPLAESDGADGAPPVVVLSHDLWQREFGGDPEAVGRVVTLDEVSHTVVGVMPAGFTFHPLAPSGWIPLTSGALARLSRVDVLARTDAALDLARAQVEALAPDLAGDQSVWDGWQLQLQPLGEVRGAPSVRTALWMLMAAVGCVLLVACVNAANLLLARSMARSQEIAIRQVLGASRGRLVRQVLTESLALAILSGIAGLALAWLMLQTVGPLIPREITLRAFHAIGLSGRILAGLVIVTIGVGLFFGLFPAWQAARRAAAPGAGASGSRLATPRDRHRVRSALLVAQLAFAVVLLAGAGLLLRSFVNLIRVPPGVEVDRLAVLEVAPSRFRYPDSVAVRRLDDRIVAELTALPGIVGVAVTQGSVPSAGFHLSAKLQVEGGEPIVLADNPDGLISMANVDSAYFEVVGTPIRWGRGFVSADATSPEQLVVVDDELAMMLWGPGSPVDRRFRLRETGPWLTVVGVAATAKLGGPDDRAGRFAIYYPPRPSQVGFRAYYVRTIGEPAAMLPEVRRVLREIDPAQPIYQLQTLDEAFQAERATAQFLVLLIGLFALAALVLAAVGVYGVVSFLVARRRREFAVRMAVGATGPRIRRLVLGQTIRLSLLGMSLGIVGVLAGGRWLRSLLFEVAPDDPVGIGAGALALLGVALLATILPAWRATRADPMEALRVE